MDDIEIGVLELVRQFDGRRITMASEIYHDLHIYGDDADELLVAINEQYGTTFDGFKFNAYFPNETEGLPRIAKWMGFRDKTVGSFTVGHLTECVKAGHWIEPT